MAKQRTSFAKLQRDRAKAAKKAAKQAKVQGKTDDYWGATTTANAGEQEVVVKTDPTSIEALFRGKDVLDASEMMEMVEKITAMKAAGTITEEEFEDAKIELFTRLPDA